MSTNVSNFTCSHLDLKTFPGKETPRLLLTRVVKGIKGFLSLKEGKEREERREGARAGVLL